MPHRKYTATFGDVNVNFSKNKNKEGFMKQLKSILPAALLGLCVRVSIPLHSRQPDDFLRCRGC